MVNLVSYMPAVHAGYTRMIKDLAPDQLFLVDDSLAKQHPNWERDLSKISASQMISFLQGAFPKLKIEILTDLKQLPPVFVSDNHEITKLVLGDLPHETVSYFLRWDMPKALSQPPADSDQEVTTSDVDLAKLRFAQEEAELSTVWWRQVGAAAFKDGELLLAPQHNESMPYPGVSYAQGDPRSWFNAGERGDLSLDIHAEQALIAQAAKEGISLEGASIYVTTFPCPTCANLIAAAGIKKCYFATGYSLVNGANALKAYGVELIRVVS